MTSTRLISGLIDFLIMSTVVAVFSAPEMVYKFFHALKDNNTTIGLNAYSFVTIFGYSLLIGKDIINGQSIGKRIMKMQVVDKKDHNITNPIKSVLRNITLGFWPVEFIFILINPARRIGDYIASTTVVKSQISHSKPALRSIWLKRLLSLFIAYLFALAFTLPFYLALQSIEGLR
jgi:uncharacterized RDD family membrane protein YckC